MFATHHARAVPLVANNGACQVYQSFLRFVEIEYLLSLVSSMPVVDIALPTSIPLIHDVVEIAPGVPER